MQERILFYQWHSFMNRGIERAFQQMGITYDILFFQQTDWERDTGLIGLLEKKLCENNYTLVFSVNFAPIVSQVCENRNLRYVAWVYDAPIHIREIGSLKNQCNRIFFFDRIQSEEYRKMGVMAYHMPLASDIDSFRERSDHRTQKHAEVSMVGKLYHTEYPHYCMPLNEYQRGYLEALIGAQMKVYGGYFLGELLDQSLLDGLNESYCMASGGKVTISQRELEYMLGCEITGRERYMALALLSEYFDVALYSDDANQQLKRVRYMGYADYYNVMPGVFRSSCVNLNISLKLIKSGVPLRIFDILACGGFVITNYQAELPELFVPGEDLVIYENMEDLYEKVAYYLSHEAERNRIAQHGYETVCSKYTFRQQLEKILVETKR